MSGDLAGHSIAVFLEISRESNCSFRQSIVFFEVWGVASSCISHCFSKSKPFRITSGMKKFLIKSETLKLKQKTFDKLKWTISLIISAKELINVSRNTVPILKSKSVFCFVFVDFLICIWKARTRSILHGFLWNLYRTMPQALFL